MCTRKKEDIEQAACTAPFFLQENPFHLLNREIRSLGLILRGFIIYIKKFIDKSIQDSIFQ